MARSTITVLHDQETQSYVVVGISGLTLIRNVQSALETNGYFGLPLSERPDSNEWAVIGIIDTISDSKVEDRISASFRGVFASLRVIPVNGKKLEELVQGDQIQIVIGPRGHVYWLDSVA